MMFSMNQISKRSLLSENRNSQNYVEREDFSQLQNAQFTQFDNSQYSQDFDSQKSTGSNHGEQRRATSTYEKYMSKPSLFRNNSQSSTGYSRTGQGILQNSVLDRRVSGSSQHLPSHVPSTQTLADERTAINSIVSIVQKCTDEVKHNLHSLHTSDEESKEDMKSSIKSLLSSVEDYNDKILKAIKQKEDNFTTVASLHGQIIKKDEKICELQEQKLESVTDTSNSIQESVSQFLLQQKLQIEDTLQHLLTAYQKKLSTDFNSKLDKIIEQQDILLKATTDGLMQIKHSVEDLDHRPWNNDIVPKQIQIQLDALFDKHKSEIDKLRAEITEQRKEKETSSNRKNSDLVCSSSLQTVYDFHEDDKARNTAVGMQGVTFPKPNGFLSPKAPPDMVWNSKVLFKRCNPSPIATVLPQRQTSVEPTRQMNNKPISYSRPTTRQQVDVAQNRNIPRHIGSGEIMQLQSQQARMMNKASQDRVVPRQQQIPHISGESTRYENVQTSDRKLRSQSRQSSSRQKGQNILANYESNEDSQSGDSYEQSSQATDTSSPGLKSKRSMQESSQPRHREKHRKQRKKAKSKKCSKKQSPTTRASPRNVDNKCVKANNCLTYDRKRKWSDLNRLEDRTEQNYKSARENSYDMYNFQDSPQISSQHFQQRNNQLTTIGNRAVSNWPRTAQADSYDSGADSSPSLSVTEIFIQRKVKGTRTPRKPDNYQFSGVPGPSKDFLSSPSLVQEFSNVRNYSRTFQTTQQHQIQRPGRHGDREGYRGKRKLQEIDMDSHVTHMLQSQKHRLY